MKFAIISDVHGNFPALTKVVEDARANNVDRFIFIGDYIFDLPFSNEVLQFISRMEHADVILGNKEVFLKALSEEDQSGWVFDQMGAVFQTYRELTRESFVYIASLKEEAFVSTESGRVIYASHYLKGMPSGIKTNCSSSRLHEVMRQNSFSRQQYLDEIAAQLNRNDYQTLFQSIEADVILFGHDHLQYHGYCGGKLIVNPGSCGQPLDFDRRAAYTIIEETSSGFCVEDRRVEYDVEAVIQATKKSKMYACATTWCELVFLAIRTGRDYFGKFFQIASRIAATKGEESRFFTNETWAQAQRVFSETKLDA